MAAAAAALLVIAAIGLLAWQLHSTQRAERALVLQLAEQRAIQLAAAAAERVAAIVRSADFVLLEARRIYAADRSSFRMLVELLSASFPEDPSLLLQISVADAAGAVVYSSLPHAEGVNVAERRHFAVHLDGRDRLYIGGVVRGRIGQADSIEFTRPILRKGRFAGVVAVSLSQAGLERRLASFAALSGDEVALLDGEGTVLSAAPVGRLAERLGQPLAGIHAHLRPAEALRGSFAATLPGDDAERAYAWSVAADSGLIALVALDREAALAPLEQHFRRTWGSIAPLALGLLALGAGLVALLSRMARQQGVLATSEARFRALTQLSSDWYWEQDENFRFTHLAGDLFERTGVPVESHLGRTRWEMPAPNLGEADWARHRAELEAHRPFRDFEMNRVTAAGGSRWVSVSGEPVFDERGRFTGYRGVGREITGRKRAAQALRDQTERLRIGQATARMIVMDWDIAGDRLAWSDAEAWLRGPLPASGRYPRWKDQVHPEDRERFLAIRARSLETLEGEMHEYRLVRTDGQVLWIRSHQKVFAGADGRAARMIVAMLDITERKRGELQIVRQARLLDRIFSHTRDNIVLLDRDFNFLRVSESYARACQRDIAEFEGRNYFELYPSDFEHEARWVRATRSAGTWRERPFVFPDRPERGTTYWDLALVPILDAAGDIECFLFTLQDVTERVRSIARERESAVRLSRLSRRLREGEERERRAMARELHDRIGQNLSTLDLMLGMLGQRIAAGQSDDARAQLAEMRQLLRSCVNHARDLMSELRPPALEEFGLAAALKDLAADASRRTGIAVSVAGAAASPRPPLAQELALYRIAQEALNNIVRHARATNAALEIAAREGTLTLAIRDDGIGFDPQAPREGRSWGLATMRERAEEAGIDFALESAPGHGTRLVLALKRDNA